MKKRIFACTAVYFALFATIFSCVPADKSEQIEYFAMDTYMTIKAYGKNAEAVLSECEKETRRIETLLSVSSDMGDVYRINHASGKPVQVSTETANMLSDALALSAETDGAFDPTVYPLVKCWGFLSPVQRVPAAEEILTVLPAVGFENVTIQSGSVSLPDGAGLDLGGVAKGYATDRLVELLRAQGVDSAILSLGGNVYALGSRPDGEAWRIAVQDPSDPDAVIGVISACDTAVITSGSYQRYFSADGVTYHHILDPQTGYPAENGLSSVTIISENAARADALSTALFVMGYERAVSFWRADDGFAAVFVFDDGAIAYTENAPFTATESDSRIIAK